MDLLHPSDCRNTNREMVEKIGKRICELRRSKGLSREELALKLGISSQQLFKYEVGENRITVDRLVAVAEALELKIINFFLVDDLGEGVGLPVLNCDEDYQILESCARLKELSGIEVFKRIMGLVAK
jgi:transcriptional regulator with XRE-family HTH domain